MVQVYYNQKDTEKFVAKVLKNGGTANVRKPYGERDPFTEIEWTHNANKQITQIIYGWPNRYKVLEEYEKTPEMTDREYDRLVYDAYYRCIHEYENPNDGRKVYTNKW